jgi:hypothetical protein
MIPMKWSTIFKNRWMALIWAAGIIWFAYDFAASSAPPANSTDGNEVQVTDASGQPVSPDEANKLNEALKGL